MSESSAALNRAKAAIAAIERDRAPIVRPPVPTGHAAIDAALGGGLMRGRLHEVFAADAADAGAAIGFGAMLAARLAGTGPIVWLRGEEIERSARLHAPGLVELGIDPARLVLGVSGDPLMLLRAAAEVVRCDAVAVAVIELWRYPRPLDLTASRRLAVAAEASGVTALMLRVAAEPTPSAAHTRWQLSSAPSRPLEANAPGLATIDLTLARQRGGAAGRRWRVEWDRDARCLADAAVPGDLAAMAGHRSLDARPWADTG